MKTFLPKNYEIPKATEQDKINFLKAKAKNGNWAMSQLEQIWGVDSDFQTSDCGEPPVEYSRL